MTLLREEWFEEKLWGALMGWRMGFGCVTRWEGMADLLVSLGVVVSQEARDCALCTAYPISET